MLFDPKIKPRLWNLKLDTIAFNCARMGLPMFTAGYPLWEHSGLIAHDLIGGYDIILDSSSMWIPEGLRGDDTNNYDGISTKTKVVGSGGNTIFVRMRTTDNIKYGVLLGWFDASNKGLLLQIHAGTIRIWKNQGSDVTIDTVNDGQWHTLACVDDGTASENIDVYINGKFSETLNHANWDTSISTACKVYLLSSGNDGYIVDGDISCGYIFPAALVPSQVQTLHNNSCGIFEQVKSPAIWSFVSGGVFYKTITGSMPASAGNIVSVGSYKQTVIGDMPTTIATIVKQVDTRVVGNIPASTAVIIKKTDKQFMGEQPAPTGAVIYKSVYKQSTMGSVPASTGIVVKGVKKDIVGDVPNPVADITKKISIQVVGSVPASTAIVVKKTEKELVGEQLAAVGNVTYKSVYKQAITGDAPTTTGSLGFTIKTVLAVAGNMPASVGNAIKRIGKMLSGDSPTSTGSIARQTEKNVAGEQPTPTGSVSHTTKTFLSGIMGNITGILDTVLNPIVPTTVKLCKLIGSCFKKFLG
jgi:hypothetical protein